MPATITPEQVEEVITDAITRFGPDPEDVTPDATLEALDIDSLDLVELSQIVDEEFGVALKSADVAELETVGDAIALVVARAA